METNPVLKAELRQLLALYWVGKHLSFRQAAEDLSYTQSAISQQIASLERHVGEKLVHRPGGSRKISLTPAGQILSRHASAIVEQLNSANADLAALYAGQKGILRIGTFQSMATQFLPHVIPTILEQRPGVQLLLTESSSHAFLFSKLEKGDLDLTFWEVDVPSGPYEAVRILEDPFLLIVPPKSPLASNDQPLPIHCLTDTSLIGLRDCASMARVEEHLESILSRPLNMLFRCSDNSTVIALVRAGLASALASRLMIGDESTIVPLRLDTVLPKRIVYLIWHKDRYQSPIAKHFIEAVREVGSAYEERLRPASNQEVDLP